jgi:trehalose-phosphatase
MIRHFREGHGWVRERLRQASHPSFLFDFDGTLAPIVARPAQARLPRETKAALGRLCKSSRVAILSGRPVKELRSRISLPVWLVGNHGLEERSPQGTLRKTNVARFQKPLREVSRALRILSHESPGSLVEWKKFSVTFHYRNVKNARVAAIREKIDRVLLPHTDLELHRGRKVFEIRIRGEGDKGTALDRLRKRWKSDFIAYFGDDVTDEDGFRKLGKGDLPVRVGFPRKDTAARYFLRTPREVRQAIDFLAEVRNGS